MELVDFMEQIVFSLARMAMLEDVFGDDSKLMLMKDMHEVLDEIKDYEGDALKTLLPPHTLEACTRIRNAVERTVNNKPVDLSPPRTSRFEMFSNNSASEVAHGGSFSSEGGTEKNRLTEYKEMVEGVVKTYSTQSVVDLTNKLSKDDEAARNFRINCLFFLDDFELFQGHISENYRISQAIKRRQFVLASKLEAGTQGSVGWDVDDDKEVGHDGSGEGDKEEEKDGKGVKGEEDDADKDDEDDKKGNSMGKVRPQASMKVASSSSQPSYRRNSSVTRNASILNFFGDAVDMMMGVGGGDQFENKNQTKHGALELTWKNVVKRFVSFASEHMADEGENVSAFGETYNIKPCD